MLHEIMAAAKLKHAHLVEELVPVLALLRRQLRLEEIKNTIMDPDLQFFLGVLMNVPDRELAMSIMREQYPPGDPVDTATELVDRLSKLGALGFRLNDTWRFMFSCFWRGISDPAEIERLLAGRYGTEAVSNQRDQIHTLAKVLIKFWMLEPYFQPLSATEYVRRSGLENTIEPLFETAGPA
jgi:hypothetical protein